MFSGSDIFVNENDIYLRNKNHCGHRHMLLNVEISFFRSLILNVLCQSALSSRPIINASVWKASVESSFKILSFCVV